MWFSDKGLAQGGQGPGCEMGEGKEDELEYSVFPKARRSIPLERAVSLAHSCPEVKSGDYKGRLSGFATIMVKVTLAMECHALQLLPGPKERKEDLGVGDLLYL